MKKTVMLLVVVACCLALGARADARIPEKLKVTTNTPIETPGKIALPAGTYVFKRLDLPSGFDIVQIFNEDETQLLNTVIGIADYKEEPPEHAMISLYETEPGNPPALHALFFPGDRIGIEFVYPKDRAMELSKQTGKNVMAGQTATAKNPSVQPTSDELTEMQRQIVTAVTPDGRSISIVEARKASEN